MLSILDQNNEITRFWRAAEWLTLSPAARSPGTVIGSIPAGDKSFCFYFLDSSSLKLTYKSFVRIKFKFSRLKMVKFEEFHYLQRITKNEVQCNKLTIRTKLQSNIFQKENNWWEKGTKTDGFQFFFQTMQNDLKL